MRPKKLQNCCDNLSQFTKSTKDSDRKKCGKYHIDDTLYDEWSIDKTSPSSHQLDDANLILQEEDKITNYHMYHHKHRKKE